MSIKYQTMDYMLKFNCLGGDCEDTCCREWEVKLDKKHYDLLDKAVQDDEVIKKIFQDNIVLNEDSITGDHDYAFIKMGDDGYCAFLDDSKLCLLHKKFGETPLGNVCAMFPRMVSRHDDTIELSAALSCPEVVRRCISDNNPLKRSRFKATELLRKGYPIQREVYSDYQNPYENNFSDVRDAMMKVMSQEDFVLDTRLYALVNFAHSISGAYHRNCNNADSLADDISSHTSAEHLEKIDDYIQSLDIDLSVGLVVIHSIFQIKLHQSPDEITSQLYKNILDKLGAGDDTVALLSDLFSMCLHEIDDESRSYIDKALTRYILNCLYREWFVSMPDPFTYIHMLLVRLALMRFILYMTVYTELQTGDKSREEIVVQVMYNFARNLDQNHEFLKVIYNALSEQQMMNFDFSVAFIKL